MHLITLPFGGAVGGLINLLALDQSVDIARILLGAFEPSAGGNQLLLQLGINVWPGRRQILKLGTVGKVSDATYLDFDVVQQLLHFSDLGSVLASIERGHVRLKHLVHQVQVRDGLGPVWEVLVGNRKLVDGFGKTAVVGFQALLLGLHSLLVVRDGLFELIWIKSAQRGAGHYRFQGKGRPEREGPRPAYAGSS